MEYICQKKNRKLNYIGGDGKKFKKEILSHLGTVTLESHSHLLRALRPFSMVRSWHWQ